MESNTQRDLASDEDAYHSARREAMRADLAKRLRKVCANFPEEDFRKLVDGMVEQKLRGERKPF
jgi:hypothetical protein